MCGEIDPAPELTVIPRVPLSIPRDRRIDERTRRFPILEDGHVDGHLGSPSTPDVPRQRREPRMRVRHPLSDEQTPTGFAVRLAPRLGDGERRIRDPEPGVRGDRDGELVFL